MIYNAFDVVVVPFPFADSGRSKRRPALVLSSSKNFNLGTGHSVMAMITSAHNDPWPLDVNIVDLKKAGLISSSVMRMKLFTLDHRLIIEKIGTLAKQDRLSLIASIDKLMQDVYSFSSK